MLSLQKSLHSKYMKMLTDAIKSVQGSPDKDIQNWVAGVRTLSDSVAILMSLACLEAILKKKIEVEEPELLVPGADVGETTNARGGICDPSVEGSSRSQCARNNQAVPSVILTDPKSGDISPAEEEKSATNTVTFVKREVSIIAPVLESGMATSSLTTPLPGENPTTPSRAPPSSRPFIHHAWTPRPTPQSLRREYAFNHKSHFELAWVPEFGNAVPRTVEEALPAHYFQVNMGAVTPSPQAPAPAPDATSSSGRVKSEHCEDEDSDERISPPERLTRSKVSTADVKPPGPLAASDPSHEGSSQLRRTRSMGPEPEAIPSPSSAHKRKRNKDDGGDDGEPYPARRTRSKPNDV